MATTKQNTDSIGWVGMGRMGYAMAERLLKAGNTVAVWNRTQSKAEPLVAQGAQLAKQVSELATCDIVFVMLSTSNDVKHVLFGEAGLLSTGDKPKCVVECSTISAEASAEIREKLNGLGIDYLASPVSGNAKCVKAGKLGVVASGPEASFEKVRPYLETIGGLGVTYVGEGELARIVKICHNVFLGIVTQSLAELTVLAQQSGVSRNAFLDFMNKSVMGSIFSKYKTPGWVNLDYSVTFTPELMRKDMDLGLQMGRNLEVPMPTASVVRDQMQQSMGQGNRETMDFSILLDYMAKCSGIDKLEAENVEVSNGLEIESE